MTGGGTAAGVGQLTSGLPTSNRAASYTFSSHQLNQIAGTGRVSAMVATPNSSSTLISYAPGSAIAVLGSGSLTSETSFSFFPSESMGIGAGQAFAATSSPNNAGSGDIFRRVGSNWNIALDSDHAEMNVAMVGSELLALGGGEGELGRIYKFDGTSGVFSGVATINSAIPMAAAELGGVTYVAATSSDIGGGQARLYRMLGSAVEEIAIPGAGGGNGVRQEITSLIHVVYGQTAPVVSSTGGTGGAFTGLTYASDIATIMASRCAACHATAVTTATQMKFSSLTAVNDYSVVVARVNAGTPAASLLLTKALNTSAIAHGGGAVFANTSDADYVKILQWIQDGALETAPAGSGGGSTTVLGAQGELLFLAMGSFDRASGSPLGGAVLASDGVSFEIMYSFAAGEAPTSLAWTDNTLYMGTSNGRLLFRQGDGTWSEETALPSNLGIECLLARETDTLLIGTRGETGAQVLVRKPGVAAPAPSPSPSPMPATRTYSADIAPIMAARCAVCHATAVTTATQMKLTSNTAVNDYAVVVARANTADPANSLLLVKAIGGMAHGGGATIMNTSTDYATILEWIQQGAAQ